MQRLLIASRHLDLHARIAQPGTDVPVTTIVDTSTPVPGGQGDFTFLTFPTISGQNVAVQGGNGKQTQNLYTSIQGVLQAAAVVGQPVPEAQGVFTGFGLPWISGEKIAFRGLGSQGTDGIYVGATGHAARVADTSTTIPGQNVRFSSFQSWPGLDGNQAAFAGAGEGVSGVYIGSSASDITKIADTSTPIPDGSGTFTSFSDPAISGHSVAFFGNGPGTKIQAGLYSSTDGKLGAVADLNTEAPDGSGKFSGFGVPAISGNTVAFHAITPSNEGMYARSGDDSVRVVADLNTPVPGGAGTFNGFHSDPSIVGDTVAFRAYSSVGAGLYASVAGKLVKIIDQSDTIQGKELLYLGMANGDLGAGVVAFYAVTGPGVFGIYTATVPNP